ncbi:MAG: response regulator [Candidatus Paceibacterota bacterium]|jgi:DNA-binding response OmpR family regulator|nr:response regulator [Candidatus Paceibacterota bacterium]
MDKKKMLIVEDDGLILDTLAHRFREEGFYVTAVSDGDMAQKNIAEDCPDIILLDILIPKVDGMKVLTDLRENENGKNVPVIILTNLPDSSKVAEAVSHGVYDYLVKADWKLDNLVKKVKGYFPQA